MPKHTLPRPDPKKTLSYATPTRTLDAIHHVGIHTGREIILKEAYILVLVVSLDDAIVLKGRRQGARFELLRKFKFHLPLVQVHNVCTQHPLNVNCQVCNAPQFRAPAQ